MSDGIWIFLGENSKMPCACFDSLDSARLIIQEQRLSGLLTLYPINELVFTWAVKNEFFKPKRPEHFLPKFVSAFTSAAQPHFHFEDGQEVA